MSTLFDIDVQVDERFASEIDEPMLVAAVRAALHHQGVAGAALTLVVTDDDEVQRLNRTYRGFDEPTDVLSFAEQGEQALSVAGQTGDGLEVGNHFVLPPELAAQQEHYLGDIIIALPYTKRQAARSDRDLQAELRLLAIHGTLHLLGFDHATPDEEAEMWSIQNAVLVTLGDEPVDILTEQGRCD